MYGFRHSFISFLFMITAVFGEHQILQHFPFKLECRSYPLQMGGTSLTPNKKIRNITKGF